VNVNIVNGLDFVLIPVVHIMREHPLAGREA
jgi:hypothetical protein